MAEESKNQLSSAEQLSKLRALTESTGIVHEAQALQLRLTPFAVDPQLDDSKVKLDMENRVARFEWASAGRGVTWKPDARYAERLSALANHVPFLLGAGWQTLVSMNGVQIFPAVGKKPVKYGKSRKKSGSKSRDRKKRGR